MTFKYPGLQITSWLNLLIIELKKILASESNSLRVLDVDFFN